MALWSRYSMRFPFPLPARPGVWGEVGRAEVSHALVREFFVLAIPIFSWVGRKVIEPRSPLTPAALCMRGEVTGRCGRRE